MRDVPNREDRDNDLRNDVRVLKSDWSRAGTLLGLGSKSMLSSSLERCFEADLPRPVRGIDMSSCESGFDERLNDMTVFEGNCVKQVRN